MFTKIILASTLALVGLGSAALTSIRTSVDCCCGVCECSTCTCPVCAECGDDSPCCAE